MKNKAIIYITVILAVALVFMTGYYSALFFEIKECETEDLISNQRIDTEIALETIREDSFLIHGTINSIEYDKDYPIMSVLIDMNENFKFSPFMFATRSFVIDESSIISTAQKKENENPIVILEESATIVDSNLILEEGDLIVVKSSKSFQEILLNTGNHFPVLELWKIQE